MRIYGKHRWNLGYDAAIRVQKSLREKISIKPLSLKKIRFVAGADVAVSKRLGEAVTAVVVMTFPEMNLLEERYARTPLRFPYIPGLLSFREVPAILACLRKVRTPVDAILCDGQGIAHPRGVGLASHLGLIVRKPVVGCAKSRLVGDHPAVGPRRGDFARLIFDGRQVGSVLRTQDGVKPLYISPGHLVDHASSRRTVLACSTRYRLPEPTRIADRLSRAEKRRLEAG